MNIFAIGGSGQSLIFKMAAQDGVNVIDYVLIRNLMILSINAIQCLAMRKNPFNEFPWSHKHTLLWRCLTG